MVRAPVLFPDSASEVETYFRSMIAWAAAESPSERVRQVASCLQVELNNMPLAEVRDVSRGASPLLRHRLQASGVVIIRTVHQRP
jgi:hypothetical protein